MRDQRLSGRTRCAMAAMLCAAALGLALPAGAATDTAYHWGNVAIGGGGFVSAVIPSMTEKNLFYARTDVGGAYRWNETSQKWVAITDWAGVDERGLYGIEALAVDPKTPGKVYMMAGTVYWNMVNGKGRTAFLRSSDYGATWEKIFVWDTANQQFNANGNGMGRGSGERLAVDPNDPNIMFYGSKDKGLFKSSDNGSTWLHVDGFTTAAGYDTTWNGSGFSFVAFAPGSSDTLYAGFLREGDNVFRSTDGGKTWAALSIPSKLTSTAGGTKVRLMPLRIAIAPTDTALYITFSDGAGPHTMAWSEGWGMIYDGFGRGAVLKYSVTSGEWTDISPEDFIDDTATVAGIYDDSTDLEHGKYKYIAPYGGVAIDPNNPNVLLVSTMGYRGAQFWKLDSTGKNWKDQWGTNVYRTTNGGKTWDPSFQYYWTAGGYYPTTEQMSANGIGWMFNSSIHWTGSVLIDPNNSDRAFITSGNGIFRCENLSDYDTIAAGYFDSATNYYYSTRSVKQRQVWKVSSQGVEEVVPEDVVSIPGGPLVSVIGDYDGFRHDDVTAYPANRLQTSVNGTKVSLGSTRALAYAPLSGKLVKVADARSANPTGYTVVPLDPVQISSDSGSTWSVGTYSSIDTLYKKGNVAISADGAVVIWVPGEYKGTSGDYPAQLYSSSNWSAISGIDGAYVVGDPATAGTFYAYKKSDGSFYRSADKGATFTKVSTPGASDYRKFRLIPGRTGDIWLPVYASGTAGSLMHSTDGGTTFTAVSGVTKCEAVGYGKAAEGSSYPALFVYATIGGVNGVFQSDDSGSTWKQVSDSLHLYGGLANGEFVVGDMNTYGVVYMSTAGRGIAARLPGREDVTGISVKRTTAATLGSALLRGDMLDVTVYGTPVSVRVYGLNGRLISSRSLQHSTTISLSSMISRRGMYILKVDAGSSQLMTRRITQLR